MSMTLIDYFLAFEELKRHRPLSAGTQSVYFTILGEFNRAGYPMELVMSLRELQVKAGLKSTSTAQQCRNCLKNMGLIDFITVDGTTSWRLKSDLAEAHEKKRREQQANILRTISERYPNGNRTPEGFFGYRACGEEKRSEEEKRADGTVREEAEAYGATGGSNEPDWRQYAEMAF